MRNYRVRSVCTSCPRPLSIAPGVLDSHGLCRLHGRQELVRQKLATLPDKIYALLLHVMDGLGISWARGFEK